MRLVRLLRLAGDRGLKHQTLEGLQNADLFWAAEERIKVLENERDVVKKIMGERSDGRQHDDVCTCDRCAVYAAMKSPDYV